MIVTSFPHTHVKESRAKHEIRISVPCFYETPQLLPLLWIYWSYVSGLPFAVRASYIFFINLIGTGNVFDSEQLGLSLNLRQFSSTLQLRENMNSKALLALLCCAAGAFERRPFHLRIWHLIKTGTKRKRRKMQM